MKPEHRATAAVVLGIIMLVGIALWISDRNRVREYAAAHAATEQAIRHVIATDTVWRERKAEATAARIAYRTVRDSALHDLRDTALVKRAFAQADTGFTHDTVTIAAAVTTIAARDTVIVRERTEIAAALNLPSPRTAVSLEALYDPLTGVPAVGASASLRLFGRIGAIGRVEQRFAVGEKVRGYVGVSVRL